MSKLEVRTPDGRSTAHTLSRRSSVVVGRNPISDIPITDEGVAPIHCRVSWNGKGFEIAAVAPEGVDVNGVLVRRKELTDGDVIRVGAVDLVLVNGSGESVKAAVDAIGDRGQDSPRSERAHAKDPEERDDLEIVSAGEIEIPVMEPEARPNRAPTEPRREPPGIEKELPVLSLDRATKPERPSDKKPLTAEPESAGFRARFRRRRRPGEQEAVRSPLVLGLGGLTLALLLAAGTIWLLIGREAADRLYEAANAHREAGRYADAIAGYEQFLKDYARDSRADDARYELGRTRVERYAAGGSPDWRKAIDEFDRFAQARRDEPDFEKRRGGLLELAESIAAGAAAAATRDGDRESLAAAAEGAKLFDRYSPADGSEEEVRGRLTKGYAAAEAAVRKREYLEAALRKIKAALEKTELATAFEVRANLVTRYPDLVTDKRIQTLLTNTLDAERTLVKAITVPDAGRQEAGGSVESDAALTIIGHTQARAGEVSDGRTVFALTRDAVVALDAVTGNPRWRRAIGLDSPFPPIEVDASVPALLAFDASRNDLVLLRQDDGMPLWRSSVGAAASGGPLVSQGQIDLPTADGRLLRFSLESGELLAGVSFPQGIVGPPVLVDGGERMVVFGDRATAYTLDLRSLEVRSVSFIGQAAGAIVAPPIALGRLVVLCENDRLESASVRAFAIEAETGALRQVAVERIDGRTREPLVARGNVLFVPSSSERIAAFSVSDASGQAPLTRLAGIQIPESKDVPTYLVPGPEGLLWAAGSALRKLRLAPNGLELLPGTIAPGRHTQPPQESGESLFVARSLASSPAVYVSQADREAMTGSWRTVLGGSVLAVSAVGETAAAVTDAGQIVTVPPDRNEGFLNSTPLPGWNETSTEPLFAAALTESRIAVWQGGPAPSTWLVRAGETPRPPKSLAAPFECPPIALDGGIVLPFPGRLDWLPESNGNEIEAFSLPVGSDEKTKPKWRSLTRLDRGRFLAADDAGLLRVIAVRPEPLPHLAEVASLSLEQRPITMSVAAVGERVVVAIGKQVRLLDPSGLRPVAEARFGENVASGLWSDGDVVFVQTADDALAALDGETLEERWRAPLGAAAAGGPISIAEGWIAASQTGTVVAIGADGAVRSRVDLEEALTGLHRIGDEVFAASLGGALHLVTLPVTSTKPTTESPSQEAPSR